MAAPRVEFVYFHPKPWYGARLARETIALHATNYSYHGVPQTSVTSAVGAPAILFSFLASREYFHVFDALEAAKLPYKAKDRGANHPIVIAGGAACFNPEPIADLVDVFCVGDGEEFLAGIDAALGQPTKAARLAALGELPGAYVPARRTMIYDDTGFFVKDIEGDTSTIIPHVTEQWLDPPSVSKGPSEKEIELARGCAKSCFFCAISWRYPYRERPFDETRRILDAHGKPMFYFAPNTGGVSYYKDITGNRGRSTQGDMTVMDFNKLDEPAPEEWNGMRFTFGIEGISERLRRLVGKPISETAMDEVQRRIILGHPVAQQLYYIRSIPTESSQDWKAIDDFLDKYLETWRQLRIATELQFTPLTKTAHTPLQYVAHSYNFESEDRVFELIAKAKADTKHIHFITESRLGPSYLIDTFHGLAGRNGLTFLWAYRRNALGDLSVRHSKSIAFVKVKEMARRCGFDPDAMLGAWPYDARLPYSHIQPGGPAGFERMLKAAKSLERKLTTAKGEEHEFRGQDLLNPLSDRELEPGGVHPQFAVTRWD